MALRNILLRITGDGDDARREVGEVIDDLNKLDNTNAEARVSIAADAAKAQLTILNQRLERLSQQESTPKVQIAMGKTLAQIERVEAKLAKLAGETVEVDIDVRRGNLESVATGIGAALRGITSAGGTVLGTVQTLAGGLTSLGPLVTGLAITIGVALAPALLLLGSSLAAAALGAGALGVALVGLAGPVVLGLVAFFSSFGNILQAVKERGQDASTGTQQVTGATEALAAAQENLRTQTTAAWEAYSDAIEKVRDDLLAVERAELGVDQARLSVKEAQQALRDFRDESGTAGSGLDDLFKKFTDVNFRGDLSGITDAARVSGASGEDSLKLERLILNVRDAKLREKEAADTLGDATRSLARDRRIEARYLREGIGANDGYRAALRGVASAQRAMAGATERQARAWDKLSSTERGVVRGIERLQGAFGKAFGPGVRAALRGVTTLFDRLGDALSDPKVVAGFTVLGRSFGGIFRTIAREIGRRDFRESFTELTRAAARLIRTLGSSTIRTTLRLFMAIATEALPPLERGLRAVSRWMDRIFRRGAEKLPMRDAVDSLVKTEPTTRLEVWIARVVDQFKTWLDIARELKGIVVGFLRAAGGEGQTLAEELRTILSRWNRWVNDEEGQRKLRGFFRDLRIEVEKVATAIKEVATAMDTITGIGGGGFDEDKAKRDIGRRYGLVRHSGGPIPGVAEVPVLAQGGEFMIRKAVVQSIGMPALRALNAGDIGAFGALAAAGRSGGPNIGEVHNHISTTGAGLADPRLLGAQLAMELRKMGR